MAGMVSEVEKLVGLYSSAAVSSTYPIAPRWRSSRAIGTTSANESRTGEGLAESVVLDGSYQAEAGLL